MSVTELEAPPAVRDPLAAATAKWSGIGLSTLPADRDAAVEAVRAAYTSVGLPPPARVVWFDSPLAGARAAALLTGRRPLPGQPSVPSDDIADALEAQGCPATPGTAGVSVRAAVRTEPWNAARDQVFAALGSDGWARLWVACGAEVWRTVTELLAAPIRAHLRTELHSFLGGHPAGAVLLEAAGGQHDAGWLAPFDAAEPAILGTPAATALVRAAQRLSGLANLARTSGWWWPYTEVAILTERPADVRRDDSGRLHAADGPAVAYADGFALHRWHGTPIPPELIGRLRSLTRRRIAAEPDPAARQVMLEHYGYGRFLREGYAQRLAADECGVLWRAHFGDHDTDEPVIVVEMRDGTESRWLRVPPATRTAREGVAWTFGLTADAYAPLVES
jgi:hypothetical protein